jgi:hypothetical protein
MMILKQGVDIAGARPELVIGMLLVAGRFEKARCNLVVTSATREPVEGKFSYHEFGSNRAFDGRTVFRCLVGEAVWYGNEELSLHMPGWDCILETHFSDPMKWHHHFEWRATP